MFEHMAAKDCIEARERERKSSEISSHQGNRGMEIQAYVVERGHLAERALSNTWGCDVQEPLRAPEQN